MKKILILLCLLVTTGLMATNDLNTAMGLHFGKSTGTGYSFRKWGDAAAYQVTFAAYATGNRNPDYEDADFNGHDYKDARKNSAQVGVNYLWNLLGAEQYSFYLMSGMSYTYRRVKRFTAPGTSSWKNDNRWAIGVGPGFELRLSDRLRVSIEIPITYDQKDDIIPYMPSGGIYYYFK